MTRDELLKLKQMAEAAGPTIKLEFWDNYSVMQIPTAQSTEAYSQAVLSLPRMADEILKLRGELFAVRTAAKEAIDNIVKNEGRIAGAYLYRLRKALGEVE